MLPFKETVLPAQNGGHIPRGENTKFTSTHMLENLASTFSLTPQHPMKGETGNDNAKTKSNSNVMTNSATWPKNTISWKRSKQRF